MKSWTKTATVLLCILIGTSCSTQLRYRKTEPWNFPPAVEWNQPLETSWNNAVDMYRRLTAPKGRVWDPLMQNYQQDLSYDCQ
jgi:hypothetical protein